MNKQSVISRLDSALSDVSISARNTVLGDYADDIISEDITFEEAVNELKKDWA